MTIVELRKMTGLSQDRFAERFEIPAGTVRNWEQGRTKPPEYVLKMLEKMIKASL